MEWVLASSPNFFFPLPPLIVCYIVSAVVPFSCAAQACGCRRGVGIRTLEVSG